MARKTTPLTQLLTKLAKMAGNPKTFVIAIVILAVWLIFGMIWGMSNTWLLILNTVATVNAALMVFIIQNTQNRESKALHIKIDELIRVTKEAECELIAIEELEEGELEELRKKILKQRDGKS